jgi:hypothetical protein
MESDCCGAYSDCSEDIDICPACGEHADWNEEEEDTRWVLLEEGFPHTVLLTELEARQLLLKYIAKNPNLEYKLFYDAYYEFSEITQTN